MVNYMNRSSALLFLTIVLMVAAVFSSCSTTRKTIREPLKEQGTEYLFNSLKDNELNYNYFSAHFDATFNQNKKSTPISGQIRIQHDSLIWISVSPMMGIEMVRFLVTNDSIKYINRIDNTYFIGPFSYFNHLINSTLDFDMLQSFLTGNDFSRYENTSFKGSIDNAEYKLVTTNRRKLKKYIRNNEEVNIPIQHIWLNPETFKITRILVREISPSNRTAEAKYSHENISGQLIPTDIIFDVETDQEKTSINIEYSKVVLSDILQFPFKIPEKYTRINKF